MKLSTLISGTRFSPGLATLVVAMAALLCPGWGVQRCAADFPPPPSPAGIGIGGYQQDEPTFSIGVFQIQVETNFAFLFAPSGASVGYPGYSPSSGVLTSPVLYDSATYIGSSELRNTTALLGPPTGGFPVTMGNDPGFGNASKNPVNQIGNMAEYFAVPSWLVSPIPPAGNQEVFTEIESFDLSCGVGTLSCSSDVRVPGPPTATVTMVTAGPNALPGPYPNNVTSQSLRSIGMVREVVAAPPGVPAQSFFNIFVNVNLPSVLGTVSAADFPAASPPWGVLPYNLAELYNDDQDPLFIVNTNVTSLPPSVVYIHGETTAVPLLFKYNNGSLWSAGDLLGYVTLAGHGVTVPCTDHNPGQPDTNCCAQVPGGSVSAFLDTVLGPVGSPRPSMAVPWVRPTNSFPIPLTSWNSLVNRVGSPSTGTNNLDASVSFGTLGFSLSALTVGLWSNSVAPPSGAASVSQTNIPITFQLWSSGTYFPASGTGVVTMVISNTGSASQSLIYSNPPPVTNYTLQMTSLKSRCTWAGGPLFLRLDTNTASLGQRTIRQNAGSGYRVSDYVDANLQLSTDNINWFNASGPLRLLPSVPPATAKATAPVLTATKIGTNLVLSWSGTWVLQSATSLPATWTDLNEGIPFEGPYTNPISPQKMFFRLRN